MIPLSIFYKNNSGILHHLISFPIYDLRRLGFFVKLIVFHVAIYFLYTSNNGFFRAPMMVFLLDVFGIMK